MFIAADGEKNEINRRGAEDAKKLKRGCPR
jgi:hypothetical protein